MYCKIWYLCYLQHVNVQLSGTQIEDTHSLVLYHLSVRFVVAKSLLVFSFTFRQLYLPTH